MTSPERVGLIGVGLLGTALAERLLAAGFDVLAHDLDADCRARISTLGANPADDARTVAADCGRIVLCLPDSSVVTTVIDDIRDTVRDGAVVVDTTTGDPIVTERWSASLESRGAACVDACVLGSSEQARTGTATLLVGGDPVVVETNADLLGALSDHWTHIGPLGGGQRMKLVANLVLGLNRAALAEGLHLAESLGLDAHTALDVLAAGTTYSRVMDTKGQRMVEEDYTPVARLRQHLKDVRLMLDAARRAGTALPLSELHATLLESADALGFGDADNAAVIEAWRGLRTDDERQIDSDSEST